MNPNHYPVGTIAGHGRDPGPFQGTPRQFPPGWIIPAGQTLQPHEHSNPRFRGRAWKLPDLRRQIVSGTSTHIESLSDDEGKIGQVSAANMDMPGEYPLVRIR